MIVVLVYKNIDVLKEFFHKINLPNSHVVVVNSFYDEKSKEECKVTAEQNNADFIAIENKGYGYGNNIGVKYANENYDYDFLLLSNSDIILKDVTCLRNVKDDTALVIAPEIRMLTGKRQNPDTPWRLPFLFHITHIALSKDMRWLYMLSHIYTRMSREIFFIIRKLLHPRHLKIFSAHGSLIIFTKKAIEVLYPLFDDRMFLYNEEWYLGEKARRCGVPIVYYPELKVLHLEGASSDALSNSLFQYNKQSFDIFYRWLCD